MPISTCQVCKAALGDEDVFNQLVEAMKYNLQCGHWSQFPCECDPPCPKPSDEQLDKFNERMNAALGKDKEEDETL